MGQYWNICIVNKKNNKRSFYYPTGGIKLMEHSYLGNDTTDFICHQIENKPHYVVWYGDYVNSKEDTIVAEGSSFKGRMSSKYLLNKESEPCGDCERFIYEGKVLVNHDTKEYLSFDEYKEACLSISDPEDYDWVVHPLALLTACSNGKGGGDYHCDKATNIDKVGRWSMHLLEITTKAPEGYTNVSNWVFVEAPVEAGERYLKAL